MRWEDGALTIDIHEIGAPLPRRVHGQVRVRPRAIFNEHFPLDDAGRHLWRPIAPVAQVEVEMNHPKLRWSGAGYFDHNIGDEPLEDAFLSWDEEFVLDITVRYWQKALKAGLPGEPVYGMTLEAGLPKGFVYADGRRPTDERLQSTTGASA